MHKPKLELTAGASRAASSLSDSTGTGSCTFASSSAVRGRVPCLQIAALRVNAR